ncbi:hypothetical protein BT69DRAFT_1081129 [Atractiella rhizophila]|nr:hypothetical protein BT69DRAFT_1081129 [Atractiella rhizophila]
MALPASLLQALFSLSLPADRASTLWLRSFYVVDGRDTLPNAVWEDRRVEWCVGAVLDGDDDLDGAEGLMDVDVEGEVGQHTESKSSSGSGSVVLLDLPPGRGKRKRSVVELDDSDEVVLTGGNGNERAKKKQKEDKRLERGKEREEEEEEEEIDWCNEEERAIEGVDYEHAWYVRALASLVMGIRV